MSKDIVQELRDYDSGLPYVTVIDSITEQAANEIERLRLECEELRACFSAASRGMDHKAVFDLITNAKRYVAERRNQSNQ